MQDLTFDSFAYLRLPLAVAGFAFLIGALGTFRAAAHRAFLAAALMMVLFFHAARLAMVVFDPYLSSRPLATALHACAGRPIDRRGPSTTSFRRYSFTPTARACFCPGAASISSTVPTPPARPRFSLTIRSSRVCGRIRAAIISLTLRSALPRYQDLVGPAQLNVVAESGGKLLLTNHPLTSSVALPSPAFSRIQLMYYNASHEH